MFILHEICGEEVKEIRFLLESLPDLWKDQWISSVNIEQFLKLCDDLVRSSF